MLRNRNYSSTKISSAESISLLMSRQRSEKPSAAYLLSLNPVKFGWLEKENSSMWTKLCCCFVKPWKRRYIIIIGNYLFRFGSPEGNSPKGVPLPLDSVTLKDNANDDSLCFEVATLRKSYVFRALNVDEKLSWISAIKLRKQLAIKEGLGHLPVNSNIELVNKAGLSMFDERLRMDSENDNVQSQLNPMLLPGQTGMVM